MISILFVRQGPIHFRKGGELSAEAEIDIHCDWNVIFHHFKGSGNTWHRADIEMMLSDLDIWLKSSEQKSWKFPDNKWQIGIESTSKHR